MVRAVVRPRWDGGFGTLSVTVVNLEGKPVADVDCAISPVRPDLVLPDWAYTNTSASGRCEVGDLPATAYRVAIWQDFQIGLLAVRDVWVPKDGDAVLTIPVPQPGHGIPVD